jgi:hypothetical protein
VDINPQLIISIIGIVFVALGISVRTGWWKKWYWRTRGGAYGYIPMGCLFLLYAYESKVVQYVNSIVLVAVYVVLAILVVFLSLKPPKWIKPSWILWVEELPAATQKAMRNQAKEDDEWMEFIDSRESLQKWAKQLRK